ncbi:MAG TPA: enoyl-CoA hydratase/isomerase family protein [Rubrivivax sp.]|nr:enoyl-CoA hydratase/isomerase family protein [Rubrivivax sp.]
MGQAPAPTARTPSQWLAAASAAAFGALGSPLSDTPYVLLDLDAPQPLARGDIDALCGWLQAQPCPVIGLGEGRAAPELAAACDLHIAERESLASVVHHIGRSPLAAMTLVQVLRQSGKLDVHGALLLESLAYATLQAGPEFRRWSLAHPPALQRIAGDDGAPLRIERIGSMLSLQLNRPSSRNAMTVEMRDALVEAFELAAFDAAIDTLRVGARGACFSIGGALEEFGTAPDPATAHAVRCLRLPAAALLRTNTRSHFHLHGACIGSGIELLAFADRLTASADAFFQLPELRFGLIPGAGGCVSLPRRIGRQRTAYLALSGRRINAATALAWGLIDAIEERPPA